MCFYDNLQNRPVRSQLPFTFAALASLAISVSSHLLQGPNALGSHASCTPASMSLWWFKCLAFQKDYVERLMRRLAEASPAVGSLLMQLLKLARSRKFMAHDDRSSKLACKCRPPSLTCHVSLGKMKKNTSASRALQTNKRRS